MSAKNAIGEGAKSHEISANPKSTQIAYEDGTKTEEEETPWLLIGLAVIIALIIMSVFRKKKGTRLPAESLPGEKEIIEDSVRAESFEYEEPSQQDLGSQ